MVVVHFVSILGSGFDGVPRELRGGPGSGFEWQISCDTHFVCSFSPFPKFLCFFFLSEKSILKYKLILSSFVFTKSFVTQPDGRLYIGEAGLELLTLLLHLTNTRGSGIASAPEPWVFYFVTSSDNLFHLSKDPNLCQD